MTIEELLKLEKKKSNVEEFFALLYGQKISSPFLVYNFLPIDFSRIHALEVWQIENKDHFYFVLYFHNQPFIIVKNVFCINREIYRDSILYISNNLDLKSVPVLNRNSRIT